MQICRHRNKTLTGCDSCGTHVFALVCLIHQTAPCVIQWTIDSPTLVCWPIGAQWQCDELASIHHKQGKRELQKVKNILAQASDPTAHLPT